MAVLKPSLHSEERNLKGRSVLCVAVSRENVEFLIEVEDQPLLDVSRVNPRLYEHVPELDEIRVSSA